MVYNNVLRTTSKSFALGNTPMRDLAERMLIATRARIEKLNKLPSSKTDSNIIFVRGFEECRENVLVLLLEGESWRVKSLEDYEG